MAVLAGRALTTRYLELLRCPVCHWDLQPEGDYLACANPNCMTVFPVVRGVPILINEPRSAFSIDDFVSGMDTTTQSLSPLLKRAIAWLPKISHNPVAPRNYRRFARLLLKYNPTPRVLVVGGGSLGEGMASLAGHPEIELVETDVYFSERTSIICDAHDLPFKSGSFDGVVAQAVLEHVVDPFRCVEEIHRVLKPEGLVYAETPFMQQVHLGRYDFMRFTHLGHRKLFGHFEEITSGPIAGPGMVLAWSIEYFLLAFIHSMLGRIVARGLVRIMFFWLKYFDIYFANKPGAYDGASGHFFLGKRREKDIAAKELVKLYRGAMQ